MVLSRGRGLTAGNPRRAVGSGRGECTQPPKWNAVPVPMIRNSQASGHLFARGNGNTDISFLARRYVGPDSQALV
jgi:hypothetical protein